jgi:hypothetical protein
VVIDSSSSSSFSSSIPSGHPPVLCCGLAGPPDEAAIRSGELPASWLIGCGSNRFTLPHLTSPEEPARLSC